MLLIMPSRKYRPEINFIFEIIKLPQIKTMMKLLTDEVRLKGEHEFHSAIWETVFVRLAASTIN